MSNSDDPKKSNKHPLPVSSKNRRAAIRNLVISGGIIGGTAKTWSKPVVEFAMLPAHAESSILRDPCGLVIIPESFTEYTVQVSGLVVGPGNVGITVNITVDAGSQSDSGMDMTDDSGAYGPVFLGPFDICVDPTDPVATVTSPSFADTAMCSASHGKDVADCPPPP